MDKQTWQTDVYMDKDRWMDEQTRKTDGYIIQIGKQNDNIFINKTYPN